MVVPAAAVVVVRPPPALTSVTAAALRRRRRRLSLLVDGDHEAVPPGDALLGEDRRPRRARPRLDPVAALVAPMASPDARTSHRAMNGRTAVAVPWARSWVSFRPVSLMVPLFSMV